MKNCGVRIKDANKIVDSLSKYGDYFVFLLEVFVYQDADAITKEHVIKTLRLDEVPDFIKSFRSIENAHIFATSDECFVKNLLKEESRLPNFLVCLDCKKYEKKYKVPILCVVDGELIT